MRRKLPSTQALIRFEAAARHASFTKAAQELASALRPSVVRVDVLGFGDGP